MGKVLPLRKPKQAMAKISVAMPTHNMVPAMFMYDYGALMMHTAQHLPEGVIFGSTICKGTYVHSARQDLIDDLMANGFTHILWLDTDMRFPKDALFRLMAHKKDMVGINYCTRSDPPTFVGMKRVGSVASGGERLQTNADSTGIEEVEALGFGMVLLKVAALKNMPDPKLRPWFWFEWMPELGEQMGEDVTFCKLFREAGHTIYVDHDLSKECRHVGEFEYTLERAQAWREKIAEHEREAAVS